MIKVGVTGGIGSGKTLVCSIFNHLGIPVYNADEQARKLILSDQTISSYIKKRFGKDLYTQTGLDRKKLAAIVFTDPVALKDLNSVVHPAVKKDFEQWAQNHAQAPYIIKEAAILFESGANKGLDKIITVTAPEELRIARAIKRDQTGEEEIRKRMQFQSSDEDKIHQSDFVIYNDGEKLILPQIIEIHRLLLS